MVQVIKSDGTQKSDGTIAIIKPDGSVKKEGGTSTGSSLEEFSKVLTGTTVTILFAEHAVTNIVSAVVIRDSDLEVISVETKIDNSTGEVVLTSNIDLTGHTLYIN